MKKAQSKRKTLYYNGKSCFLRTVHSKSVGLISSGVKDDASASYVSLLLGIIKLPRRSACHVAVSYFAAAVTDYRDIYWHSGYGLGSSHGHAAF